MQPRLPHAPPSCTPLPLIHALFEALSIAYGASPPLQDFIRASRARCCPGHAPNDWCAAHAIHDAILSPSSGTCLYVKSFEGLFSPPRASPSPLALVRQLFGLLADFNSAGSSLFFPQGRLPPPRPPSLPPSSPIEMRFARYSADRGGTVGAVMGGLEVPLPASMRGAPIHLSQAIVDALDGSKVYSPSGLLVTSCDLPAATPLCIPATLTLPGFATAGLPGSFAYQPVCYVVLPQGAAVATVHSLLPPRTLAPPSVVWGEAEEVDEGVEALPPSPLTPPERVKWAVEGRLLDLCRLNNFTAGEARSAVTLLTAALCGHPSAAWTGGAAMAALGVSLRKVVLDFDFSYDEGDCTAATHPNRDAILDALKAAVASIATAAERPTIVSMEPRSERFLTTTAFSPLGVCATGRVLDVTLEFQSGKQLIFQLAERDHRWTAWQLTSTYWGNFMNVTVQAEAGKLVGYHAPPGPHLINPLCLVRAVQALPPRVAITMLEDFLVALAGLLATPRAEISDHLTAKHPAFNPCWRGNPAFRPDMERWSAQKEEQEGALIKLMPSQAITLREFETVPRVARKHSVNISAQARARHAALAALRKREWSVVHPFFCSPREQSLTLTPHCAPTAPTPTPTPTPLQYSGATSVTILMAASSTTSRRPAAPSTPCFGTLPWAAPTPSGRPQRLPPSFPPLQQRAPCPGAWTLSYPRAPPSSSFLRHPRPLRESQCPRSSPSAPNATATLWQAWRPCSHAPCPRARAPLQLQPLPVMRATPAPALATCTGSWPCCWLLFSRTASTVTGLASFLMCTFLSRTQPFSSCRMMPPSQAAWQGDSTLRLLQRCGASSAPFSLTVGSQGWTLWHLRWSAALSCSQAFLPRWGHARGS